MGDKTTKMRIAQDMKRFREKYSHPVQVRVFNVLKHWIDQHFYDFGSDHDLQHKLNMFLDSIHGKSMKKWVECISKIVQRRVSKTIYVSKNSSKNSSKISSKNSSKNSSKHLSKNLSKKSLKNLEKLQDSYISVNVDTNLGS